jgi:hypothetical protein
MYPIGKKFIDAILQEMYIPSQELCHCCFRDIKIWFEPTTHKTFPQRPKQEGPNRGSTVDDAERANQTFVSSSMFLKLVFR